MSGLSPNVDYDVVHISKYLQTGHVFVVQALSYA